MVRVLTSVMGAGTLKVSWPSRKNGRSSGNSSEPLVDLDLRPIGLDLRKVAIEREVGGEVGSDAVLHVQRPFRRAVLVEAALAGVVPARVNGGEGRKHLHVPAGREPGQAVHDAHLRHEAGDPARHGKHHRDLVLAGNAPDDLETPSVHVVDAQGRIAQALERDRDFRGPTVVGQTSRREEQRVP